MFASLSISVFVYWCDSRFRLKIVFTRQLKTKRQSQLESFRTCGCFICDFVYTNYIRKKTNIY